MSSVKLLSPAKVNLFLRILGKRPDGYHELQSVLQPVSLFDEISLSVEPGEGSGLLSSGRGDALGKRQSRRGGFPPSILSVPGYRKGFPWE